MTGRINHHRARWMGGREQEILFDVNFCTHWRKTRRKRRKKNWLTYDDDEIFFNVYIRGISQVG